MPAAASEQKTLLLTMRDGLKKRITIPASWKVTFGPLVPGSKDTTVNGSTAIALRLWSGSKGSEVQHGVFTNVESFREMGTISVMEEQEQARQEHYRSMDEQNQEVVAVDVRVKEWVDPDAPKTKAAPVRGEPYKPGNLIELARK